MRMNERIRLDDDFEGVDVGLTSGPDAEYLLVPVDRDMFVRMLEDLRLSARLQNRVMDNLWQVTLTREPNFTASEEAFKELNVYARKAGEALGLMYDQLEGIMNRHAESPLFGFRALVDRRHIENETEYDEDEKRTP